MESLSSEIKKSCEKRINLCKKALAKNESDSQALYEKAEARLFEAMVTLWETGDDKQFPDDITKDLRAAIASTSDNNIKDKYEKAFTVVLNYCNLG